MKSGSNTYWLAIHLEAVLVRLIDLLRLHAQLLPSHHLPL
jgi:hypothetical protein